MLGIIFSILAIVLSSITIILQTIFYWMPLIKTRKKERIIYKIKTLKSGTVLDEKLTGDYKPEKHSNCPLCGKEY